ncbi:antibiotic biosynthesis monooxygenase [Mycobacterium sp. 236(2023)]|uniref:antibiotic biosynthesis monooxygenase n=1 Tax=Mycobacterium sp. 236(2023) TaxID=3038163 RepID=UPI00241594B5|nr:antibiotic biosynthesis monooxygenase [Mycobacterium sp. 236(2023)]MDG4663283.1 antibiotic biosynthesis monooxygenase [Mycobacterium sp. 236(2023)]
MTRVTAVAVFHRPPDGTQFDAWADELLASARAAPGHVSGRVAIHDDLRLDWAVAVTFSDEDTLHAWLDSAERAQILAGGEGRGIWRSSGDLILGDQGPASPGVGVFRHTVTAGKEHEFRDMQTRLAAAAVALPGHEGTTLLPADERGQWTSMVRYRTGHQLAAWMDSDARAQALRGLRSTLTADFTTVSNTTPFATTVRIEHGRTLMTPNWKSAMLVLAVLYPTVMLLSRFLGPIVNSAGAQPWLALWISQIVSVVAMQWWLMPAVSRPFAGWLDPVDGAGARVSAKGALAIVVVYAVTLTLFATVRELQFWDYMD